MRYTIMMLLFFPSLGIAQKDIISKIDSLKFVSKIPYICEIIYDGDSNLKEDSFPYSFGCGDKIFWNAVQLKGSAILYLIEELDNLGETPASFPNQGGQCHVADIAYIVLEEIVHGIPTAALLDVDPDDFDCGYCYYHLTLADKKNRKKFKKAVYDWYQENKQYMIWVSNNQFGTCDCSGKHPNGGHYEIKK